MDEIDGTVVRHLLRHGRASFAEIGAAANLSASAAKRRVDRLVERGTIRGFAAVIDARAMGWETEAYVEVFCRGNVSPHTLRTHLAQIPEVIGACTVSGRADARVQVLARDVEHLERVLQVIRSGADIERTETEIVLSRLIARTQNGALSGGSA